MAAKYFVVLGGSASGIYDTLAEAEAKSRLKNEQSSQSLVEILQHSSLAEAFKCLQNYKSQGNKCAISATSQNSQQTSDKRANQCVFSADVQYVAQITGTEQSIGKTTSEKNEESFESGCKDGKSVFGPPSSVEIKSEKGPVEQKSEKSKRAKKTVKQTRNVCIQADRGPNKVCLRCKNEKQGRKLLINIETQTVNENGQKPDQTKDPATGSRCHCSLIAESASKCHITDVDFSNLSSFSTPFLDFLTSSVSENRVALPDKWIEGKEREWFLRQDTFALTLYQSKNPRAKTKKSLMKSPSAFKNVRVSPSPKSAAAMSRKRSSGGSKLSNGPFKIPKKGKLDKEVRVQLGEDELEAEEEMMDTMLCTQARLKDVTYSARDIPHGCVGMDYEQIFNDYLSISVTHVIVEDAYIRAHFQIANLVRFINLLIRRTSLAKLQLRTSKCGTKFQEQQAQLMELKECLLTTKNIQFEITFDSRLHDRIIKFNNGWAMALGRGLDYFQKSQSMLDRNDMSLRKTRAFRVLTYKCPKF